MFHLCVLPGNCGASSRKQGSSLVGSSYIATIPLQLALLGAQVIETSRVPPMLHHAPNKADSSSRSGGGPPKCFIYACCPGIVEQVLGSTGSSLVGSGYIATIPLQLALLGAQVIETSRAPPMLP